MSAAGRVGFDCRLVGSGRSTSQAPQLQQGTAGRTNQTLLTLLPSDTICPCAFNCFLPHLYVLLPVPTRCCPGQKTLERAASQSSGCVQDRPGYGRECVVYCSQLSPFIPFPVLPPTNPPSVKLCIQATCPRPKSSKLVSTNFLSLAFLTLA